MNRRGKVATIRTKRAYDPPARGDGRRILVERLWPRGMKKEALALEAWPKDVAPSTALRKWFAHRVERWDEFRQRYREELETNRAAWQPILEASDGRTITLLYSAHDTEHNSAVVLRDYLMAKRRGRGGERAAGKKAVGKKAATEKGGTAKSR